MVTAVTVTTFLDFAISTLQNRGCVCKGIYFTVVKMPSTSVKYALYGSKVWHFRGYNRHLLLP